MTDAYSPDRPRDERDELRPWRGSGATLTHEYSSGVKAEHEAVSLAPGLYKVTRQREYVAPKIERRVVD